MNSKITQREWDRSVGYGVPPVIPKCGCGRTKDPDKLCDGSHGLPLEEKKDDK